MRAIFLDKDGTLLNDVPYNVDPALVQLSPRAAQALRLFRRLGYALFVVSNQSGIAKGWFDEQALQSVERRVAELLSARGAALDGFYFCPHHPDGVIERYAFECNCRKPMPGLLRQAADQHDIDLKQSWMIGDILDDVEAGRRAGCRTILIDNGNETEWEISSQRTPYLVVSNLYHAAKAVQKIVGITIPARFPGSENSARS
jgi:histidinol-phosphate phosphatase family protein